MTQERRERFQGRSDALTSDEEARLLHQSAAAEARFQGLIEVAPDAIVEVDGNGTIVLINGQTEMLFGYPRNELLGKPVDLLLPERFRQAHAGHRSGYMRSPHIRPMGAQLELLGRRKDGSEFPVEISLGPVDMDGDTAIVATIRDVTRRVQTEEALRNQADELRRQSNLIDLANDAIIVLDTNRVVLSWNHGAERIYGWTSDEAQGRVLNDMLQTRYPDSFEAVERALASGGHWDGELSHRARDGRWLVIESRQVLLQATSRSPATILAINRDITERRLAEEAREAARREAEEANEAKSEFLSRMSHELRTPLNAILGFGQLLALEDLQPQDRDSVDHIIKAGRHLLELINEVLDISRIEAGRLGLSPEPVSIDEVLDEAAELIQPLARDLDVQLVQEPRDAGLFVLADRQRIRQVLLNLLTNAVKYNRQGGDVKIGCSVTDSQKLRISILDTGHGIEAEKLSRLFTPFDRLGAEQTGVEGTGLGLSLSRRLMAAMGGSIGVESTPGTGSTFWIELPRTESLLARKGTAVSVAALEAAPSTLRTVLYIEDNVDSSQLMERIFARWPGVRLISAMQGRLGIELAQRHKPDLVLLDLHLPDIQGIEVLERLRADPETSRIPIIVTSADATPGQIARLKAAGADDYLTKPLDIPRFSEIVRKRLA